MTVKKGKVLCFSISPGQHCWGSLPSGGDSCHLCFLPELPVDKGRMKTQGANWPEHMNVCAQPSSFKRFCGFAVYFKKYSCGSFCQ